MENGDTPKAVENNMTVVVPEAGDTHLTKGLILVKWVLYLMCGEFVIATVASLGMLIILDRALSTNLGLHYLALQNFSSFGFLFLLPALCAPYFGYVASTVLSRSQRIYWMALLGAIGLPLLVGVVQRILLLPVAGLSDSVDNPVIGLLSTNWGTLLLNLFLPVVVCVQLFRKRNVFEDKPPYMRTWSRRMLWILAAFLFIPGIGYIGNGFYTLSVTDYGYAQVADQVDYHVYRSETLPLGLNYATSFETNAKLGNFEDAISVVYDTPLKDVLNKKSKIFVIRQREVRDDFDLQMFVNENLLLPREIITMDEDSIGDTRGVVYLVKRPLGTKTLNFLYYVTGDNVLIYISAPEATEMELLQVAASLK